MADHSFQRKGQPAWNPCRYFDSYAWKEEKKMSQPLPNPANKVMRDVLTTIADGYDSIRLGAGDCVREFAAEMYPTHAEQLQRLANLCDRHKREVLPRPTEFICANCVAEREATRP